MGDTEFEGREVDDQIKSGLCLLVLPSDVALLVMDFLMQCAAFRVAAQMWRNAFCAAP